MSWTGIWNLSNVVLWADMRLFLKWHLGQLSRFCTAHLCAKHTDTHSTCNTSNIPHLCTACWRCDRTNGSCVEECFDDNYRYEWRNLTKFKYSAMYPYGICRPAPISSHSTLPTPTPIPTRTHTPTPTRPTRPYILKSDTRDFLARKSVSVSVSAPRNASYESERARRTMAKL